MAASVRYRGRFILSRGVSLIELLCVTACFAVLMAITLPNIQSILARWRVQRAVSHLQTLLQTAQREALLQQTRVTVCPSINGEDCTEDWRRGWLLSTGKSEKAWRFDAANADRSDIEIDWKGNFGEHQRVRFLPNGMTHGQTGHFTLCWRAGVERRFCQRLILHFSGQISVQNA